MLLNPFIPNVFFHSYQLDEPISNFWVVGWYLSFFIQRGSYKVWKINMGVCPRLEFDNTMLINALGYDFYIYGVFKILCNSFANL